MPKLILSRKGLDSSSGGYPSPILEEKLLSIPIPQTHQGIPYNRIQTPVKRSVKSLGNELGMELPASCHLDPDLTYESLKLRPNGWKPCFGQHGAALTHLVNHKVGVGDIFLFYGRFRQAEKINRTWRFVKKSPEQHIIYGFLEVGEMIHQPHTASVPPWLTYHPHVKLAKVYGNLNTIFIAKDFSSLVEDLPGAGTFDLHTSRILTSPLASSRSLWELPACFFDPQDHCLLSYHQSRKGKRHPSRERWRLVQNVARGQEFVVEQTPSIAAWIKAVLEGQGPSL